MAADRDPRHDPQPGDRLSMGGALVRVVTSAEGDRVSWTLEARGLDNGRPGSCALSQWRRTFAHRDLKPANVTHRDAKPDNVLLDPGDPLAALPSRQRPGARAVLDACEQLSDTDRRVRCPEALRLERSGLKRSSWQRGETALVGLGLLVVESAGAHRSSVRVLRLVQPARGGPENGPREAQSDAPAGGSSRPPEAPAGPACTTQVQNRIEEEEQQQAARENPPTKQPAREPIGLDEEEQRARIECYRAWTALAERVGRELGLVLTRGLGAAPAQEQAAPPEERPATSPRRDPKPQLLALDGEGDGSRLMAWAEQATGSALPDELEGAAAVLERTSGAEEEWRRAALLRVLEESRRPAGCRNPPGFARFVLAGMDDAQARGVIATHLRAQRSPMQHAATSWSIAAAATRAALQAVHGVSTPSDERASPAQRRDEPTTTEAGDGARPGGCSTDAA